MAPLCALVPTPTTAGAVLERDDGEREDERSEGRALDMRRRRRRKRTFWKSQCPSTCTV